MATVYLARDLKHKRPLALKVLRPELAASLGPERFQREIELAARRRERKRRFRSVQLPLGDATVVGPEPVGDLAPEQAQSSS